jgi:cyclic-di-GMP-binding protein
VTGLTLSIPTKRVSAWITETDPKEARAWLETLPLADSAESARQIYQALHALNRIDLDATQRLEVMELYTLPVATVAHGLHGYLANPALPLSPKRRQLAEFIRELYVEMAHGYKCSLLDMQKRGSGRDKRQLTGAVIERAMYYLGGVLLRSYLVYIPNPPGIWREIHSLYRFAEENGRLDEPVPAHGSESGTSVRRCYLRILLLAVTNPYQLPSNEQLLAYRFLGKWAETAKIGVMPTVAGSANECVVDLSSDSPPMTRPATVPKEAEAQFRRLDSAGLVRTVMVLGARLQGGESVPADELGMDCLNRVCVSLLRRLGRAWAQMVRREHSRIRRSGNVSVCRGLDAVHFFAGGLKPYVGPGDEPKTNEEQAGLPPVQDLESPATEQENARASWAMESSVPYRIDRWRVRDISPKGLNLAYGGNATSYVRIGDLVGVQRPGQLGIWSVGIVRWLKSPNEQTLTMGVELVAPNVRAVTAGRGIAAGARAAHYTLGLLLPSMPAIRRPASLLVPRGWQEEGAEFELIEDGEPARCFRALKVSERNNACDEIVFAATEDGATG